MTVYVVTQGCRYGGEQEQVHGVRLSRQAAERLCAEINADPKRNMMVDCPGQGQAIVQESELPTDLEGE